uniref:Coiled-coil and C2 domain-containing protein 2A n=1 Tax=Timema shepardi TaxID=629360 RepID=A0A7R9FYF3_TIMSH|nr:unnamed protein product [Timema shepardi]
MQGYTVTPVRLLIHREQCKDVQLEQIVWDQKIQNEIEDLEEELRETHNQDLDRYTQELEQWNENNKSISEEKSTEPCPPKHLDLATVRSIAVQSLSKYLRPPGEPNIHLELGTTTLSNTQNNNEKLRQSAVSRCQVFVKVFFNNKEVCQSSKRPLGSNFFVNFQEIFPICITEWPHTLKLELYEEGGTFNKHLLAEVYIPIPLSTTTLQSCEATRHQFSNTQVVTVSHAGVGSGVYISPLPNNLQECLYTSGYIICRVGWGLDELNGTILAPPDKYAAQEKRWSCCADLMGMLDSDGPVNVEKLRAWADKSLLDPNDPTNAAFYNFIKNTSSVFMTKPNFFRLDPLQTEFDFCSKEELDNNRRLRLLQLRDQGEADFRGISMIPAREKEIPKDFFKAYDNRVTSADTPLDSLSLDLLDAHRAWGQRFLQDIRHKILTQCQQAQQHRHLKDIIYEDQLANALVVLSSTAEDGEIKVRISVGTLGLTFMKWFQPKRPLRPVRKERKKVTVHSLAGQEVKIIINIVQAFDVPVRKDIDTVANWTGSQSQKTAVVPVHPFVEVSFQGMTVRTTAAEGSNPTWNQELQMPLR